MCDCIKRQQKEAKTSLEGQGYDAVRDVRVLSICHVQDAGGNIVKVTHTNIDFSHVHTRENGSMKRICDRTRVVHTFCPFCGEKYVPDDNEK